jgi:hypothetical protein
MVLVLSDACARYTSRHLTSIQSTKVKFVGLTQRYSTKSTRIVEELLDDMVLDASPPWGYRQLLSHTTSCIAAPEISVSKIGFCDSHAVPCEVT